MNASDREDVTMNDRIQILTDFKPEMFKEVDAPLVSIYMPTALFATDNQKNLLTYRNLVTDAEMALAKAYSRRDYSDIIEALNLLYEDGNRDVWKYAKKGMAVLTDGSKVYVYHLDYLVESIAVVFDAYHILPLIRNFQYGAHYYLLALASDSFTLYRGDFESLQEVTLPKDVKKRFDELFPDFDNQSSVKPGSYGGPDPHYYGQNSKSDVIGREIEKFFRYVGQVITEHFVEPCKYPIILVSLTQHQTAFRELTSIPTLVEQGIEKPFESMSEAEVLAHARAIILDIQESAVASLVERFGADQAKGLASGDPATIAKALVERKVWALFVEEDKYLAGSFDAVTGALLPPVEGESNIDGLIDDFARSTYLQGGDVYVVEPGLMPSQTGVAAFFRY